MAWIWVTVALFGVALLLQPWLFRNKAKKLPPGPKGFPVFGSLHLVWKNPHASFHRLSQKYGSIMHMRLGFVPTIIVSSPHAAELFLKTHDLVFASRPSLNIFKHLSYGHKNFVFASYNSYWRNMRKMCRLELFSNFKVNSFKSYRKVELGLLVDYLQEAAYNRVVVNLSSKFTSLFVDLACLMEFGKKYEDKDFHERGFKSVLDEVLQLIVLPNLGDYIPYIAMFDLQGLTRKIKSFNKMIDDFFEKIINEHLETKDDGKTKDFVDVMLELMDCGEIEYQIDRPTIKAIMMDIFGALVDTSTTTLGWAMSELIKHPHAMKRLQDELVKVVGMDRVVEESDLENLEYLEMVVKETLRLHPPGPLLIPRESREDCTVDGFHIPKKSQIFINVWAIGRDSNIWNDPEKFFPERFINSQLDVRGRDFQLIPFGSGRRGCPGIQLGLTMVHLVLAQLVHCFDWELPNGMLPSELDMTEEFSLTLRRAQDLMVIPIYRLHN